MKFDHQKLSDVTYRVAYNLNRVIDVNYYPVEEARNSNMRHRPIGIGVQGLADTFAMLKHNFDSDEAKQLNKDIFETIYFAARNVIAESEYLQTLNKMITECRKRVFFSGLPDPRQAYLEACNKNSPKIQQTWSHAIVYLAGRDCGWFYLAKLSHIHI